MGVPFGNSSRGTAGLVSVPERYVAGTDTRGRQEGRPYPWSQQVIHKISGLEIEKGLRRFHSPQTKGLRLVARSPELPFFLGDYIHHSPLRTAGRPAANAAAALLA
jgi:hypothetical protein